MARKKALIPRPIDHLAGAEELLGRELEIIRSSSTAEHDLCMVVSGVHVLIANALDVSDRVIQSGRQLLVVATGQAGYDRIDVQAATRAGIAVIANTGAAPEPVAEFVVGLIIALSRRIVWADRDLRRLRDWATARGPYADARQRLGVELGGTTIGIVGLGNIGSKVASMCRAIFDVRLLGFDPFVSAERMAAVGVEKVDDLLTLAKEADFLLLHALLTRETHHLVNRQVLRAMKPSAFLVNCARGPIVEEAALIEALREGWIAGAALDVFEREPLPADSPLFELDNVILTPHIAGVTVQGNRRRGVQLAQRVLTALAGDRPEGLVNPEVWPQFLERLERFSAERG